MTLGMVVYVNPTTCRFLSKVDTFDHEPLALSRDTSRLVNLHPVSLAWDSVWLAWLTWLDELPNWVDSFESNMISWTMPYHMMLSRPRVVENLQSVQKNLCGTLDPAAEMSGAQRVRFRFRTSGLYKLKIILCSGPSSFFFFSFLCWDTDSANHT